MLDYTGNVNDEGFTIEITGDTEDLIVFSAMIELLSNDSIINEVDEETDETIQYKVSQLDFDPSMFNNN